MDKDELTDRQKELTQLIRAIADELGGPPTLGMLDENPNWPSRGTIRHHFGSYTNLLIRAGLPPRRCAKRYQTKKIMRDLTSFILALGRVPSQTEVRENPRLPSDEIYLTLYADWETVILKAGFTPNWCSREMAKKLVGDMWRKYVELGYQLPAVHEIQMDPRMEKVFVYTQVFGDLKCAWEVSGVWKDYCERMQKEIVKTLLRLNDEFKRVPTVHDPGMPDDKLVCKVFGSYEKALLAAGLKPNHRYYTRQQLIKQLQQKYAELKRRPRTKEVDDDPNMASMQTFRKRFGSYEAALKAAKVPTRATGQGYKYTRTELIRQLQAKAQELDKAPTTQQANDDPNMASAGVFARRFGSFENALKAAGISTRRTRAKYTRAELVQQLQVKAKALNRPPTQDEVNDDPEMASANTFTNEFGSLTKAIEAAGLKVRNKREYTDVELLESLKRKYLEMDFLRTGKRPTNKDINSDAEMASARAYDVHFGATSKAREMVEEMLTEEISAEAVLKRRELASVN